MEARVSWHSKGTPSIQDGKQECALCFSSWGHVRERNEAGGRGERLLEGLECRLPRDASEEAHPSLSSLSFLCEGRPRGTFKGHPAGAGQPLLFPGPLLKGSLLTQQDGLQVGRYP